MWKLFRPTFWLATGHQAGPSSRVEKILVTNLASYPKKTGVIRLKQQKAFLERLVYNEMAKASLENEKLKHLTAFN